MNYIFLDLKNKVLLHSFNWVLAEWVEKSRSDKCGYNMFRSHTIDYQNDGVFI